MHPPLPRAPGHETTANTMGFLMYYLSQAPEWEARIRQEIRVSDTRPPPPPVWCSNAAWLHARSLAGVARLSRAVRQAVCLPRAQEVLGGRAELTAADIPKLVVTEACFKEALRLHPPAAQIGRDAAHDTIIQVTSCEQLLRWAAQRTC